MDGSIQTPERRPSILYLEPLGVRGGMGHYNEALLLAYQDAGADVQLVTASYEPIEESAATVHVSRLFGIALNRSMPKFVRGAAYAAGYARCLPLIRGVDAVVMHFLHRPVLDRWFLEVARRLGPRLVLVAHDPTPVLEAQRGDAYRRCLRQFDLVVVHGPAAQADIVAQGVPKDRVTLAKFGDYRSADALDRDEARRALHIAAPPPPVAAIIGNLRPGKGVRRAREALEADGAPVATLLVAGKSQGAWDVADALRFSGPSGLHIEHLDRRMSDAEELAAYSLADVVLALYDRGYSSAVVARAHAIGRPVVLTNVGDVARQAGQHDVVLPVDATPDQLRAAIAICLSLPSHEPPPWDRTPWLQHARDVIAKLAASPP